MDQGWIKLHRQLLNNDGFKRDHNGLVLFIHLLLLVDRKTGSFTCGRNQLSRICELKPITAYKALKRLEKRGIVLLEPQKKYTKVTIVKWSKYQETDKKEQKQYQVGNNLGNNPQQIAEVPPVTTPSRDGNSSVTLNKNKETRTNNNNVELASQIQTVYELFCDSFNRNQNQYKLTPGRKIKIKARIKDAGLEMIEGAIKKTAKSAFHNGDNDRRWKADLDFILRSYEQVERLNQLEGSYVAHRAITAPVPEVPKLSDDERARGREKAEAIRAQLKKKGII